MLDLTLRYTPSTKILPPQQWNAGGENKVSDSVSVSSIFWNDLGHKPSRNSFLDNTDVLESSPASAKVGEQIKQKAAKR